MDEACQAICSSTHKIVLLRSWRSVYNKGTNEYHYVLNSQEDKKILQQIDQRAVRPSKGRPTRAQAELRHEQLLSCALDMFLEHGFEQATTEMIVTAVGMSKRTVYARYEDKASLFKAAVHRAIEQYTVPIETLKAIETDDLEATLAAVARLRIANMMNPVAIKLQRILTAQSYRFPELFTTAFEEGAGPVIHFLCSVFARHKARGEIDVTEPERAAIAFLSLAVSGPVRIIVSGNLLDETELEARISFAVRLFLNGIRPR